MWWLKGMNLNEIPNDRKWYAVETAFVDGELLDSKCCFVEDGSSIVGVQIASHTEAPQNFCRKEFCDRIEIHTDWFETKELAKAFSEGKITYIHHFDAYYKASIKSTLRHYRSRELVEVCEEKGIMPYRGIYKDHMLDYKPHWA